MYVTDCLPVEEKINFIIKAIEDGWSVKKANKNSYEFTYEIKNEYDTNEKDRERDTKSGGGGGSGSNRQVNRSVSVPVTKHDFIKNVFLVK